MEGIQRRTGKRDKNEEKEKEKKKKIIQKEELVKNIPQNKISKKYCNVC